jgi:hypothetical protein
MQPDLRERERERERKGKMMSIVGVNASASVREKKNKKYDQHGSHRPDLAGSDNKIWIGRSELQKSDDKMMTTVDAAPWPQTELYRTK